MTPFAIAGIQMYLNHGSNLEAMRHRVDLTMHLYPWVQMVMFSELACYGPLLQHAQPLPGVCSGCATIAGFRNIPAPMMPPMTTIVVSNTPSRRMYCVVAGVATVIV